MPKFRVLTLLMVVVVVGVKRSEGAVDCSNNAVSRCSSCTSLTFCSGGQPTFSTNCQAGSVCLEETGAPATCYADSVSAVCKCSTYPSYVEDKFDSTKYLLCLAPGTTLSLTCPSGQTYDTNIGQCADEPATTTTAPISCSEPGIFPTSTCDGYYACYYVGSDLVDSGAVSCSNDGVWDTYVSSCVSELSTPPTPTRCDDGSIVKEDAVECNAFYVCGSVGGATVGGALCCSGTQAFNKDTMQCEDNTGAVTCKANDPCLPSDYVVKCPVPETTTTISTFTTPSLTTTTPLVTTTTPPPTTTTPPPTTTTPPPTTTTPPLTTTTPPLTTTTPPLTTTTPPLTTTTPPLTTTTPPLTTTTPPLTTTTPPLTTTTPPLTTTTPPPTTTTPPHTTTTPPPTTTTPPPTTTTPPPTTTTPPPTTTTPPPTTTTPPPTTTTPPPTTTTPPPTTTTPPPTTTTIAPTTTTTTTPEPAGPPDCGTSNNGKLFEYSGDCKKYYYCFNNRQYLLECTGTLIFIPSTGLCGLTSDYTCPY